MTRMRSQVKGYEKWQRSESDECMGRCWVEMSWKRRKEERRRKSVKLIIIQYLCLNSFSPCDARSAQSYVRREAYD